MLKRAWILGSSVWALSCIYGMSAKPSIDGLDIAVAFIGFELLLLARFVVRGSLRPE